MRPISLRHLPAGDESRIDCPCKGPITLVRSRWSRSTLVNATPASAGKPTCWRVRARRAAMTARIKPDSNHRYRRDTRPALVTTNPQDAPPNDGTSRRPLVCDAAGSPSSKRVAVMIQRACIGRISARRVSSARGSFDAGSRPAAAVPPGTGIVAAADVAPAAAVEALPR